MRCVYTCGSDAHYFRVCFVASFSARCATRVASLASVRTLSSSFSGMQSKPCRAAFALIFVSLTRRGCWALCIRMCATVSFGAVGSVFAAAAASCFRIRITSASSSAAVTGPPQFPATACARNGAHMHVGHRSRGPRGHVGRHKSLVTAVTNSQRASYIGTRVRQTSCARLLARPRAMATNSCHSGYHPLPPSSSTSGAPRSADYLVCGHSSFHGVLIVKLPDPVVSILHG